MASQAYKNNGLIILWWDETEGADDTSHTLGEIVISPLAKGDAYASTVQMNHSSDLKTMEEIFHLPFVNNPIPAGETNVESSAFNNVATVNDLSDLFAPGVIPAPNFSIAYGSYENGYGKNHVFQKVIVTNNGDAPVSGPLWLALDNLSSGVSLVNSEGTTALLAPLGSPYARVNVVGLNGQYLYPHETATVTLEFVNTGGGSISYDGRLLNVVPVP